MSRSSEKENEGRWPFDPMQPGEREAARLPEARERVQKQTGHDAVEPSPDYRKSEEKRK